MTDRKASSAKEELAALRAELTRLRALEGTFHTKIAQWCEIEGELRSRTVIAEVELTRLRQVEREAIKMLIAHIAIKGSCPESLRWKSPNCYKYPAIAAAAKAAREVTDA